jgi:hypothetical protein
MHGQIGPDAPSNDPDVGLPGPNAYDVRLVVSQETG